MEQKTPDSAQSYYNHSRRRSFLFSRIFVMTSMLVLLVVLGINVGVLNTQEKTNTASHASSDQEEIQSLPSPPAGCAYHKNGGKLTVTCLTPVPQNTSQNDVPFAINLPQIPASCNFQITHLGYKLICSPTPVVIPPVVVTLPAGCAPSTNVNDMSVMCPNPSGQLRTVHLPELPKGCIYQRGTSLISVACQP